MVGKTFTNYHFWNFEIVFHKIFNFWFCMLWTLGYNNLLMMDRNNGKSIYDKFLTWQSCNPQNIYSWSLLLFNQQFKTFLS